MIFIDANILIALDNIKDVHHKKAVALVNQIEEGAFGEVFTSDYVFNEVIGYTYRKNGKKRAAKIGENMINSIIIDSVDELMLEAAWNYFKSTTLGLNLVDSTNLISMKKFGANKIATFDKEFKKVKGIKVIN